jgi:putative membrane protein
MKITAIAMVILVAVFHVLVMLLEMFFWDTPTGHRIFGLTPEGAKISEKLAMNQGLYNGFLAAGLFWSVMSKRFDLKVFFLSCVIIAGVFGAATAKPSILFSQALPAVLALAAVWLAQKKAASLK